MSSSALAGEAQAALAARFDPATGRFSGASPIAAMLFLLDRARDGDVAARRLALSALRRTPGDEVGLPRDAAAEADAHVEAVEVAPDAGLEKAARAAVDAALRAFGWSGGGELRAGDDGQGLMIETLARASQVLDAPGYRETASLAAERALEERADARSGVADYAMLIRGLLELVPASGERGWLYEAVRLQEEQDERLGASPAAGPDGNFLSGSGLTVLNLIDFSRLTAERAYRDRADAMLLSFGADMAKAPLAHLTLLRAARQFERAPFPG